MEIYIIHEESRIDRLHNVNLLCEYFPNAIVFPAISPSWIKDCGVRSVLGCSLSHLEILCNSVDNSVLILEDDAKLRSDVFNMLNLKVPEDAGAIIFGGEIPPENTVCGVGEYSKIIGQYYGSHAVWYNLKYLKSVNFFNVVYKIIATHKIGTHTNNPSDDIGMCYESILAYTLKLLNISLYRPKSMVFSTIESISQRTNMMMGPRVKFLDI